MPPTLENASPFQNQEEVFTLLENLPINIMYCDRSFIIRYMNPKTRETLKKMEHLLPTGIEQIVGQSFDIFHKNPAHQRRIVGDDRHLPHHAVIQLGPEKLQLSISAIYNPQREYTGALLTWDVITEKEFIMKTLEETSTQLGAAAEQLTSTASQLFKNAQMTSEQTHHASTTTEEVSKGVTTVATNTEEMVASIKEIARNSAQAAEISKETLQQAQKTNQTIGKLGASSQEIGNVIKVISSIAQQTNLLALNATIEAARAGDAGKGFAVVANEVKELAKQTAKATEDITNRISSIQKDTQGAVEAISSISEFIEKLNGISMAIAASIEEQTATTNEVARVIKESSKGVEGIAQVIKDVSQVAQQNSSGAAQSLEAAKSLAQLADQLKALLKNFRR